MREHYETAMQYWRDVVQRLCRSSTMVYSRRPEHSFDGRAPRIRRIPGFHELTVSQLQA